MTLVSAVEGHTLWAEQYDRELNPLLALERRILGDLLQPILSRRFIDVGCGTGRWMEYLRDRGGYTFGADACEAMVRVAEQKSALTGRCVLSDAASLPFRDEVADTTICSFAAGYFPDLRQALRELARVTHRNGRVIISDLHPKAIAVGWARSFKVADTRYELNHFHYKEIDFLRAAELADLKIEKLLDGSFDEPERPIFERAGKATSFEAVTRIPAVWICAWTRL
jgi:ubiquinone/menaquinone biosynthesis C-methylase UbiE